MSHSLPIDVISDLESCPPIAFATTLHTITYLNARGALIVAISHQFPPLSTVIIYKKGGLRWFGEVCGGLWWFAVVCGISTVRAFHISYSPDAIGNYQDDILYSALKVIKLFLEERLTRGNFPIVIQGIRTMFS